MRWWKIALGVGFASALVLGPTAAMAAPTSTNTVRVTQSSLRDGYPSNPSASDNLWYREDTRAGGGVSLSTPEAGNPITAAPAPLEPGSLALSTQDYNYAKAQLFTYGNDVRGTPLVAVTELGYQTFQTAPTPSVGDPAFQLRIDGDGNLSTTADQANLVFEPYFNTDEGAIVPNTWQAWDAKAGQWWSSKDVACPGAPGIPNGKAGDVKEDWGTLLTDCPTAVVAAIGVNVGSYNPNYMTAVDGVHFATATQSTTWDFGPK